MKTGRPTKESKGVSVSMYLSEAENERLSAFAFKVDICRSQLVDAFIQAGLDQAELFFREGGFSARTWHGDFQKWVKSGANCRAA
jgi:hypothetical protein